MFALDHVHLSIPVGGAEVARAFYVGLLGMEEEVRPAELSGREGCWFRAGAAHVHVGAEEPFVPQKRAHPAFLTRDVEELAEKLQAAGRPVLWDRRPPDRRRFHTEDPFGNRIEFIATGDGFSQRQVALV